MVHGFCHPFDKGAWIPQMTSTGVWDFVVLISSPRAMIVGVCTYSTCTFPCLNESRDLSRRRTTSSVEQGRAHERRADRPRPSLHASRLSSVYWLGKSAEFLEAPRGFSVEARRTPHFTRPFGFIQQWPCQEIEPVPFIGLETTVWLDTGLVHSAVRLTALS